VKIEIQLGTDPQADVKSKRLGISVEEYASQHFLARIKIKKRSGKNDQFLLKTCS